MSGAMSSFFTTSTLQKKRKRINAGESPRKRAALPGRPPKVTKPSRQKQREASISGSESEEDEEKPDHFNRGSAAESTSGSEEEGETAAERRLRLAERYLENIREEVDEVGFDAEDVDRDLIAERLKEDVAESKGRLYRNLAVELSFHEGFHTLFRNDSQTVTSIATCPPYAYTASKDMWLVKWCLQDLPADQRLKKESRKLTKPLPPPRRRPEKVASVKGNKKMAKDNKYQGHVDAILTVAASQDGKFVVTGGRDRRIVIWNAHDLKPLKVFSQHRDAVTGLAFRRGTNQLYSSSKDRTVKIWSLNELAYVETLFGHQDEVVDVAALAQERCISVGARDRTARLWKVIEETQLVFRGGGSGEKKSRKSPGGPTAIMEGSMDRIAMVDEDTFVTGSDNGSLSLWVTHKKKPIFTLPLAHGINPPISPEAASAEANPDPKLVPAPQPCWITALATIPFSDVVLSGSWDGYVRAWRVSTDKKRIEALGVVGHPGSTPDLGQGAVLSSNGLGQPGPDSPLSADKIMLLHGKVEQNQKGAPKPIARGVINDISVFERGDRGKDGICIVVALGKEHRLGRWAQVPGGKNGAVVFEVPRMGKVSGVNGLHDGKPSKEIVNGTAEDGEKMRYRTK